MNANPSSNNSGTPTDNQDRFEHLAQRLSSVYNQYNFYFEANHKIYNQHIQVFSFCKTGAMPQQNRKKYMITFNANPGDVLWNIRDCSKSGVTELMRIHNRLTQTSAMSQNLFRGKDFFSDQQARTPYARMSPAHSSTTPRQPANLKHHSQQESKVAQPAKTQPTAPPSNRKNSPDKTIPSKKSMTVETMKSLFARKGWIKKR